MTSIGAYAFSVCSSLTTVTIPNSVTSIGDYAFEHCRNLTAINVAEENSAYSSVDGVLYNKTKTELICCPGGITGYFVIPDSVTSIRSGAFGGCITVTSIELPDSVTTIGRAAFSRCINLTSIELPDSVTSIDASAFNRCTSLTDVYYTGTAEQWNKISIGSNNDYLTGANIHCDFRPVEADAAISVGSAKVLVGGEVVIPVSITKNPGIAGFSFAVSYDGSLLTLTSVEAGAVLNGGVSVNGNFVNWYELNSDNVNGTGELLRLHFTVNANAPEGTVRLSVGLKDGKASNLSNADAKAVSVEFLPGELTISTGVPGDVTDDDDVTIADVVRLNRAVLGKVTLSEKEKQLGDVTHDGDITIADVVKLNCFVLGKIESLDA